MSRYSVHHGLYQRKSAGFDDFAEALAFFIECASAACSLWLEPMLVGKGYDGADDDGLTDDERAALEMAGEIAA
jgi:hypothetical protein